VPQARDQRHRLRELCGHMLGLENHFLVCYREFLLSELRAEDEDGQRFATARPG
jgi:hypothetical protein